MAITVKSGDLVSGAVVLVSDQKDIKQALRELRSPMINGVAYRHMEKQGKQVTAIRDDSPRGIQFVDMEHGTVVQDPNVPRFINDPHLLGVQRTIVLSLQKSALSSLEDVLNNQ